MAYQKDQEDAFYHHYVYDADQRLSQAFTSKDGENKKLQATYHYYLHGPLKRVELADGLQGTDYVYTINGALKAINHADPVKDPGGDGMNNNIGQDVFGMSLAYYEGDYKGAGYDAGEISVTGYDNQYGGAIKAVGWHNGTEIGTSRVYAYDYDEKYQLSQANWGEMTGTNSYSFLEAIDNAHQVTIPAYDKHGNIQSLNRKGSVGNILGDYTYNYQAQSNKLNSIDHSGTPLVTYEYDAIGRTTTQTEGSDIMHLAYDAYGMVKEIRNGDNELKVAFRYDDKGMRVCKEAFDEAGNLALRTWYVRDIAGNVMSIYQEDVAGNLAAAQTEIPIYGASRLAVYKPQQQTIFYEFKDHLGSVRAVIGSVETAHYRAGMEISKESDEASDFPNYYETTRISASVYNHTDTPDANRSFRLSGAAGEIIGLAKSLKVYPGDTISMEVYGKYFAPTNQNTTVGGDIAAALADAFELPLAGVDGLPALNAINTLFQPGPLLTAVDWEDDTAPKAFINYILFDSDFIPYDYGFDQIDVDAMEDGSGVPHDYMSAKAVATKPGYIYIYLSNENDKVVDVHFDDIYITHSFSPIVAGADYYPFGMVMEGREVTQEDWRYGYQGAFAEEDEETGYTAFELRMYDSRFGRWTSTDPYGQYWSPYVGMGNAPHMGMDPDGGLFGLSTGWSAVAGAGIGFALVGGVAYLAGEEDWWKYGLAGAAVGGVVAGVTATPNRSLGNKLPGQYNNATTNPGGKLRYPSYKGKLSKTFPLFHREQFGVIDPFLEISVWATFPMPRVFKNFNFDFSVENTLSFDVELFGPNGKLAHRYSRGVTIGSNSSSSGTGESQTPQFNENGKYKVNTRAFLQKDRGDVGSEMYMGDEQGQVQLNVNTRRMSHRQYSVLKARGWKGKVRRLHRWWQFWKW